MRIEIVGVPKGREDTSPAAMDTPLMVVPVYREEYNRNILPQDSPAFKALEGRVGGVMERAHAEGRFQGEEGQWIEGCGRDAPGPERIRFVGMGKMHNRTGYRNTAGRAVRAAEEHGLSSLTLCLAHLDARKANFWGSGVGYVAVAVAEGLVMAAWRFDEFKSRPVPSREKAPARPVESVKVLVPEDDEQEWRESIREGEVFGQAANLTRTLQARPGNVATPTHLAETAEKIAEEAGLECTIMGPKELEREHMRALLAVARGSREEPRMIVLRHSGGGRYQESLVLVGKGLTFDAGGISIKPAKGMEDMKYDMSGGAAVLGALWGAGRLGLKCNVVGIVPCAENLPGGSALKPGDIVTTRSGMTVEVTNTDAEGRLILADALSYALTTRPRFIVDCATLTGASVVALGHFFSALFANDPELAEDLQRAGGRKDEYCWRMPASDEYLRQLDSDFADIKNAGGRAAGAITAACFLSEFVDGVDWAHLDVAGTAYGKTEKPYLRDGPTGNPCRLLLSWLQHSQPV